MSDPQMQEPDVRLRASIGADSIVRIHTRNLTLEARGRASWAPGAERPSALDHLLAAVAADLLSGLSEESRRAGLAIQDVELRLEARLAHPLVVAGVVGESGSPGLAQIRGSLYVQTDGVESAVETSWRRACERAPVTASLAPGVAIDIQLKIVE